MVSGRAGEWASRKKKMSGRIHTHKELRVYQNTMEAAMEIFTLTRAPDGGKVLPGRPNASGLHDRYVRTSLKRGESVDIELPLSQS